MIIIEKDESPILFFDMGLNKYGNSTFKSHYNDNLGYLAENDHLNFLDSDREIDIIISHLHNDHFKNVPGNLIESILENTGLSLRRIWAPPVDLLFTSETNFEVLVSKAGSIKLNDLSTDIEQLFSQLNHFHESDQGGERVDIKNSLIKSERRGVLSESFRVKWLAPPATLEKDFRSLTQIQDMVDINSVSPLVNTEAYMRRLGENINKSSPSQFPFFYSPRTLLLTSNEELADFGFSSPLRKNTSIYNNLSSVAKQFISDGENNDPLNRTSSVLKITDKETKTSALLTGDATSETIAYLLSEHKKELESVDLLQVPHHGSNNGLISPIFFSAITADHAFIQHGSLDEYGHPRPETLADLILAGTANVHHATVASDFMYEDDTEQVYSNSNNLGEETRSLLDKATIIAATDLTGELTPDEIINRYNLTNEEEIGLNRTLENIFSDIDGIRLGPVSKEITIREIIDHLGYGTDIGLQEAAELLQSIEEDMTLIDALDDKWPVIISPIDLRLSDLVNHIEDLPTQDRLWDIWQLDSIIIDRTEDEKRTLESNEEIAYHLIVFDRVPTDNIDYDEVDLTDSPFIGPDYSIPPKDATLEQLKEEGGVSEEQITELRGATIENRLVIHDSIYTWEDRPSPEKTESDFRPGELLGYTVERPDLNKPFKKSSTHTRHYAVEMTPGFLSLANDRLDSVLDDSPDYPNMPSRKYIARRGVELVKNDIFSPFDILKNIIRRNVRKQETLSEGDSSTLKSFHPADGAALYWFDQYLDDDMKGNEYGELYDETNRADKPLPTEFD